MLCKSLALSYACFISLILFAANAFALPDTCNQATWLTNGVVNAMVPAGDKVYIGGQFTYVGPYTGGGAPVGKASARVARTFPKIKGTVKCVSADGNGGWFVGGTFTVVGTAARNNIVHIFADGTVDAGWDPNANGDVRAIAVSGTTVYVGGAFQRIGGQLRYSIAALDAATGTATLWDPNPSGTVQALAISASTVYVGGEFLNIGGQTRHNIAALDATTGNAVAWDPNASMSDRYRHAFVSALAVSGATVYAGGQFDCIGGQARDGIAALDALTGVATSWTPNADHPGAFGSVYAIALSRNTVYAGGYFTYFGGQPRNHLAALDARTGAVTSWDPKVKGDNGIFSLAVSGSTVYVGGCFISIGGQKRKNIAALDAATGTATSWNPNAAGTVQALAMNANTVYVGGDFASIGGLTRNHIAALDAKTGAATSWNPDAWNPMGEIVTDDYAYVNSLAISGNTVYAGGDFRNIGGQPRSSIAALDATTGNATAWKPEVIGGWGSVNALAVIGTTVYAGGGFIGIGGQPRSRIAALDAATGNATAWNPNARMIDTAFLANIYAFAVSGTTMYVCGDFDSIGGQARKNIAALDATTGNATAWNPNANHTVHGLAMSGTTAYVCGDFDSIGGQARKHIAALDAATGNSTAWNPNPSENNPVFQPWVAALAISGPIMYVVGIFDNIGGLARNGIAALDEATGNATAWNPNAGGVKAISAPGALAVSGTTLYVGGGVIGHPFFTQFGDIYPTEILSPAEPLSCIPKAVSFTIRKPGIISYSLSAAEHVSLRLYDINGRLQSEIVNSNQKAGTYTVGISRNLSARAYIAVFRAGKFSQRKTGIKL